MERIWAFDQGLSFGLFNHQANHPALGRAASALAELGAPVVLAAVTGAVVLVLALRRHWRPAGVLALVAAAAVALNVATKAVVHRDRPGVPVDQPGTASYP